MIGFITTSQIANAVTAAIGDAQSSKGLPVTWLLVGMPIYAGEHVGKCFIQADEDVLDCPLRRKTTPQDFPEFDALVASLGGLDARVDIDPAFLVKPQQP